jgi:hypothetical protein
VGRAAVGSTCHVVGNIHPEEEVRSCHADDRSKAEAEGRRRRNRLGSLDRLGRRTLLRDVEGSLEVGSLGGHMVLPCFRRLVVVKVYAVTLGLG